MEDKYNFDLDMVGENSNSAILKNINPNSLVLECGCAHGRMTKYLKENLNCTVYIAEYNGDAGKHASQWANKSFYGSNGNIEDEDFFTNIKSLGANNLDYIIFADVLEHLHYPEKVLEKSKSLLKNNGSIWLSIPNIGHNSVLIDLLNNKFTYRSLGLLDDTHIRFFTYYSLKNMVNKCGLSIAQEINLQNSVENTEFNNSYEDVNEEVSTFLKNREHAETYQFVWELKII